MITHHGVMFCEHADTLSVAQTYLAVISRTCLPSKCARNQLPALRRRGTLHRSELFVVPVKHPKLASLPDTV